MAVNNNQERINRLQTYADNLKARLTGSVPEKHKNSPESFKQFIEIDLKKTLAKIQELKGL